jgi:RHS repeat-associated protein
MLSFGGASTTYDGLGNRVAQTVSATVTRYLLDLQPGLAVVLSETTGANTTRYVHGPRGIHAQKDAAGNWEHPLTDGLGSVRGVVDTNANVLWSANLDGYGNPFSTVGTTQTNYGFTGEYGLPGGLVHLRSRNYHPALGVFASLDPFEGMAGRPMSLNGYGWVEGNTPNAVDPSGEFIGVVPLLIAGGAAVLVALATAAYYSYLNPNPNSCSSFNPQNCTDAQDISDAIDSVADSAGQACMLTTYAIIALLTQSQSTSISQSEQRARIAEEDEAAIRRDARNPFDLAFGLSNYSGVYPPEIPWGDLTAFAGSFTERRALPFLVWPEWLVRKEDGINWHNTLRMGVEAFEAALPSFISYYLANIPDGLIRFNLSGMDNRPIGEVESKNHSVTRYELELMLSQFQQYTRFYLFDPRTTVRTQLQEPDLSIKLNQIRLTPQN